MTAMTRTVLLALLLTVGLAGCATKQVGREIATTTSIAENSYKKTEEHVSPAIEYKARPWVNPNPIPFTGKDKIVYPDKLQQPRRWIFGEPITLAGLVSVITMETGYSVSIMPDVDNPTGTAGATAPAAGGPVSAVPGTATVGSTPGPAAPAAAAGTTGSRNNNGGKIVFDDLQFYGSVIQLMDYITRRENLAWRWEQERGRLVLHRFETREFVVAHLPGTANFKMSSASGAGSGQNDYSSQELAPWKSIEKEVKSMLSPMGKLTVSSDMATLTVTDMPSIMNRLEEYFSGLNKKLTRQIQFNVQLYTVRSRYADQFALNWDALFTSLSGKYNLAFRSSAPTLGNNLTATVLNPTSQWSGTKAIFDALREQGEASAIDGWGLFAADGMPVSMNNREKFSYVSSVKTTATVNSGVSTEIQQSTETVGIYLAILPRIINHNLIMARFTGEISSIQLSAFTQGTSTVQQPTVKTTEINNTFNLRSNQTLILTGYMHQGASDNSSGVPVAALGTSRNKNQDRQLVVLVITPQIIESPL